MYGTTCYPAMPRKGLYDRYSQKHGLEAYLVDLEPDVDRCRGFRRRGVLRLSSSFPPKLLITLLLLLLRVELHGDSRARRFVSRRLSRRFPVRRSVRPRESNRASRMGRWMQRRIGSFSRGGASQGMMRPYTSRRAIRHADLWSSRLQKRGDSSAQN